MDQSVLQLSPSERILVDAILASQPIPAADELLPVRASVLRSLILGLPLRRDQTSDPIAIAIPETGLKLRYLHITDDIGDLTLPCGPTGTLHLEDACDSGGGALKPLELEFCLFPQPIHMSRARLRRLSLRGSSLVHLCAWALRVEGPLNISGVPSAEDHPRFIPPDASNPKTGALLNYAAPQEIKAPLQAQPLDQPPQSSDTSLNQPSVVPPAPPVTGIPQGRCWIQLHNSSIGDDVEAIGSVFACPPLRPRFVNSSNAYVALDLSGSTVLGRFTFGPNCIALGGINLSLTTIAGSVWGSGATLTAVEGAAFAAQGAEIQGNLVLDYSREASLTWTPFRAIGGIDLANTRVRASLRMRAAQLTLDSFGRGGLYAVRIEISSGCDLSGSPCDNPALGPFVPFYSAAGINLSDATIGGDFDAWGAVIATSDGTRAAIFALGITVGGGINFSSFQAQSHQGKHDYPFQITGALQLSSSTIKRDLNMQGALLLSPQGVSNYLSLAAEGANIQGSFYFNCRYSWRDGVPSVQQSRADGFILMRGVHVGDNFMMNGAKIGPVTSNTYALDISGAQIGGNAIMDSFLDDTGKRPCVIRFTVEGSLAIDTTKIGGYLSFRGASIRKQSFAKDMKAIWAANLQVGSSTTFSSFKGTYKDMAVSQIFECFGAIHLVSAIFHTGLFMEEARLMADDEGSALMTDLASMRVVDIRASQITGIVSMLHCTCSYGIDIIGVTLVYGALILSESTLGHLKLKRLRFKDPYRTDFILSLRRAKIAGLLTANMWVSETAPQPTPTPIATTPQADSAENPSEATTVWLPYVDLSNLEIGEIEDYNGLGWGDGIHTYIEGFTCTRMPHRETDLSRTPRRGASGYLYDKALAAGDSVARFRLSWLLIPLVVASEGLYEDFHKADAHIDWLNRQYRDESRPLLYEFTPGAYDQLARVLREEGHDTEAKRVLSAKFSLKRQVDVFTPAKPFWAIYHRFFDYGLSAFNAFLTFALCLLIGSALVWFANHRVGFLHHESVLVVSTSAVSNVALVDGKDASKFEVAVQTSSGTAYPEEIPCGPHRIDPFLYAVESFVPALDLGQTKLCEISAAPKYWPWRWGRALYAILGWIVTSITVLTVPGILRSRAEG